jgi:hypothetical protein
VSLLVSFGSGFCASLLTEIWRSTIYIANKLLR